DFESFWLILNGYGNGKVDYREFKHAVIGHSTEEEIKTSFPETLKDACSKSDEVSYGEFEDYYEGLSIGIVDDEDFVNILHTPWGI
ncbi:hypothetical protein EI555_009612, partial [Monodon monoceros]